jgi:hypothetical protein
MKPIALNQEKSENLMQLECIAVFLIMTIPLIYWIIQLRSSNPFLFHALGMFSGWLIWTFVEYALHRFWNHSKTADKNSPLMKSHHHHHTHPSEIRVTHGQRLYMALIGILLIFFSLTFNIYLNFIAGFWIGISWYLLVHYFLHQPWSRRLFPELLNYHIVHHCKQPDRCFGISMTFWDKVFNTGPRGNTIISQRIIDFYFNHPHEKD